MVKDTLCRQQLYETLSGCENTNILGLFDSFANLFFFTLTYFSLSCPPPPLPRHTHTWLMPSPGYISISLKISYISSLYISVLFYVIFLRRPFLTQDSTSDSLIVTLRDYQGVLHHINYNCG